MQLFYNPEISANSKDFSFPREESKHIVKVLRKSVGDQLHITNGKGWLFTAKIVVITNNKCSVKIVSKAKQEHHPYNLHLAVAPTKMNDRYEWFLEKATEIGIDSITPIICDHSERKVIKTNRFERILQSAMKQSLNCYLPKLNKAINFKDFIAQDFKGQLFIAHCEETNKKSLKKGLLPKTDVTILIGPEGDFSTKEIDLALKNNFIPVTLGTTRLRTETAAIVACHSVAFVNEVLNGQ
ncbi:16S rRNA (uracil(1498)-N(3))-methyltransferase [Jejuia pallidilutea]|uniref:Ribosomal RNA small subunit methyltransferase E n=1 Tax=Jejuia pallidilutea TaxID=504487 RepID=A0A090W5E7_9FLAO|nr:16S rRNA (uracil(1498)-N(3))-methyltransferase [Jejuia pallidilutea]PQV50256.1 16S rRNA (uracil1498-N3)-methyltransferase [Jejuia pallidilutea]GAL66969.1 ribosomal RNA small subunit methyltransferase E [Jejuia pallidilutea]GAL70674.1 ribosomal RNA small subunit methyltransferase E [Jejuia pallidilutea]GAL90553.1 ribosomal RNA small subunit methyltransferase E [Jejuia pallidilutea]